MTKLEELYEYANENGIEVDYFLLHHIKSLSTVLDGDKPVIAMDATKISTQAEETVILGHEIGHCETRSFYTKDTDRYTRCRCENKANRWAIEKLIPKRDMLEAINQGHREIWDLAEYFGLPENFVIRAIWLYRNGNMAVPSYMRKDEDELSPM